MGINYLMVFVGGAMGSVCRYAVSIQMKRVLSSEFPLATFLINLTGSFLLGMLLASNTGDMIRLLLGTGFLGGFTTFSTFQVENVALLRKGGFGTMLLYVTLSVGLSVAFAFPGFALGG
jgi:CrcB protein